LLRSLKRPSCTPEFAGVQGVVGTRVGTGQGLVGADHAPAQRWSRTRTTWRRGSSARQLALSGGVAFVVEGLGLASGVLFPSLRTIASRLAVTRRNVSQSSDLPGE